MKKQAAKAITVEVLQMKQRAMLFLTLTFFLAFLACAAFAQEKIITAHGISSFGELKYGPDFKHLDYVNPDAPKGGEISTWAQGTFDSMHPYITKGVSGAGAGSQFESLMVGTSDEADSLYGLLAESIEYPESKQWAIFHMRPEAKFSDGTPVRAEDVVFTFNILLDKGIPSLKTAFADFEKVEALDPLRVKFTFTEGANTRALISSAAAFTVMSKKYYDTHDFSESTLDVAIGSSAYVVHELEVGRKIVWRVRDDYWGKDLPINIGRDNFEFVRYEYFADPTAAFEGFKAGVFNFKAENSSKIWATGYDFPALEKGFIVKAEHPDGNIGTAQSFIFNLRKEKFKDVRVREALGMMFNFEWSNEALFYGLYERVGSFWENSTLEATGMPSAEELVYLEQVRAFIPESVFTDTAFVPPLSSNSQLDRKMLRAAGKLLDAAGWTVQNGIRTNAAGETLKVDFLNYSASFDRIINPYVEALKRLGVEATMTSIDIPSFIDRRREFDFDVVNGTIANSLTPGLGMQQFWHSTNAMVPSRNVMGFENEGIDMLMEMALAADNREDLNDVIHAIDRTLRAMHIWVPQWYKDVHTVAYRDVFAYPDNPPPYSLGQYDFWWYDEAKAEKLRAAGGL